MKKVNRSSKAIRVNKDLLSQLEPFKVGRKANWSTAIEALLKQVSNGPAWVFPSSLYKTRNQAMKDALEIAATAGLEYDDIEQPIKVLKS